MPSAARRLDLAPPYVFAELNRLKIGALKAGKDVIDLGVGDPDEPTPEGIQEALKRAVKNPATHHYDLSPRGWPPFLNAATEWFNTRYKTRLSAEQNALQVIGTKEGLAHLIWTYIETGDVAILPSPAYSVYRVNTLMAGGEPWDYPLRPETNYRLDFRSIPPDICKRAKLLVLCYPNNPTGAVVDLNYYEAAVEFCREHDILLVSDMAYATVAYDGFVPPSVLQVPGAEETCVEFHSLSKMFRMTGWRLGFAMGQPEALSNLQRLKSNVDTKAFAAVAEAGAYALKHEDPTAVVARYQARRDALCGALAEIGWNVEKPKASFYVWAAIPSGWSSLDFSLELLRSTGVMLTPGESYGPEGEGFVRFSLTLEGDIAGERFVEAAQRIKASGILLAK